MCSRDVSGGTASSVTKKQDFSKRQGLSTQGHSAHHVKLKFSN
jgi:hypothetical protein